MSTKGLNIGVVFLLGNLLSASLWAQGSELWDMDLDKLGQLEINTSTQTFTPAHLSPSVITTINASEIKAYGYRDLAEVLNHVAGFTDNYDLATHNFGVRGVNAGSRAGSRIIKFMLDGQPISFRASSQNFIGPELIALELVKYIEVVRGPLSALYGADAFLGVVNIVTRSAEDFSAGDLSVFYRDYDHGEEGRGLSLAEGFNWQSWDFVVGGNIEQHDRGGISLPRISPDHGFYADGINEHQLAAKEDQSDPASIYFRAKTSVEDSFNLTLSAHAQRFQADNHFADLNALNPLEHNHIGLAQGFVRAEIDSQLGSYWQLNSYIAHARGEPSKKNTTEAGTGSLSLQRELEYRSQDLGIKLIRQASIGSSFLMGVDFSDTDQLLKTFVEVDASGKGTELNAGGQDRFVNTGLFIQWQQAWSENWGTIIGGRLDDHSIYETQESFRFGLVGDLGHSRVVKFLAGSSFQAPSADLLFREAVEVQDIIGNPQLQPQKALTFEVQLAAPIMSQLDGSFNLYHMEVEDLVLYQSDLQNITPQNSARSTTYGLELELKGHWQYWQGYFNYSYQQTERDSPDSSLFVLDHREEGELFPQHMFNFGLRYELPSLNLQLSMDNRFVGERPASTQNVRISKQFYTLSEFIDTSLNARWRFNVFNKRPSVLGFKVTDLWDTRYVTPGFGGIDFPSLGRAYEFRLEQKF